MKYNITLIAFVSAIGSLTSQAAILASYDFPAANSLVATTVDANLTASDVALSSSTIATNVTSGSYFPNQPYIQGTGWTATTQGAAKNFYITLTASPGYTFSIENISFNGYATASGPSAIGFSVGSTAIFSQNATDSTLMLVNQAVTGQTGLTSVVVKFEGWVNGSRTTSGGGDYRFDDLVISGTVSPIPEPSISLLGILGCLGFLRRRR